MIFPSPLHNLIFSTTGLMNSTPPPLGVGGIRNCIDPCLEHLSGDGEPPELLLGVGQLLHLQLQSVLHHFILLTNRAPMLLLLFNNVNGVKGSIGNGSITMMTQLGPLTRNHNLMKKEKN